MHNFKISIPELFTNILTQLKMLHSEARNQNKASRAKYQQSFQGVSNFDDGWKFGVAVLNVH